MRVRVKARVRSSVPWVPEAFHARFPISFKS